MRARPRRPARRRARRSAPRRRDPTRSGRRTVPEPTGRAAQAEVFQSSGRGRLPGVDEGYFGERVAAVYDDHSAGMFDPAVVEPAVELLAELAGDGAALEFAVGTGRIALPLAGRGVRVAGMDNSEAMLARLREKPGAERIQPLIGDMAATRVDGEFSLVYLVFNTIFNLVEQDGQVACFANAAAHLSTGGRFVIEARVPELQRLPLGQTMLPWRAEPGGISAYVYDVVKQRLSGQHYHFID